MFFPQVPWDPHFWGYKKTFFRIFCNKWASLDIFVYIFTQTDWSYMCRSNSFIQRPRNYALKQFELRSSKTLSNLKEHPYTIYKAAFSLEFGIVNWKLIHSFLWLVTQIWKKKKNLKVELMICIIFKVQES